MFVDTETDEMPLVSSDPDYDREPYLGDLRGLVMSGGKPYILIVLEDPESGGVAISHQGLADDVDLSQAFREIAKAVDAARV